MIHFDEKPAHNAILSCRVSRSTRKLPNTRKQQDSSSINMIDFSFKRICSAMAIVVAALVWMGAGVSPANGQSEAKAGAAQKPDDPEMIAEQKRQAIANAKNFAGQFDVDPKLQKQFNEAYDDWRNTVRQLHKVRVNYVGANSSDEAETLREEYSDLITKGNQQLEIVLPLALQLFKENGTHTWKVDDPPSAQIDLDYLITQIQNHLFEKGRFDQAFDLGAALLKNNSENRLADYTRRRAGLLTNRFIDIGNFAVDFEDEMEKLPAIEKNLMRILPQIGEAFEVEKLLRQRDDAADDLPHVQLKTTKGTVVFELFENEAPDTVGNFISLVEKNFYDGLIFHRVIDRFMVQGGAYTDKKENKPVGYQIYDEHKKKGIRLHYRGSLSMAKTDAPNSGGSQFFVCLVPTPGLNGKHTVFGRVISGMDVFDRITRTQRLTEDGEEEMLPDAVRDKIISATLIRKRDHEYKPNRVQ